MGRAKPSWDWLVIDLGKAQHFERICRGWRLAFMAIMGAIHSFFEFEHARASIPKRADGGNPYIHC